MPKKQLIVTRTKRDHYIPEYDEDVAFFEHIFGGYEVGRGCFNRNSDLVAAHGRQLVVREQSDE